MDGILPFYRAAGYGKNKGTQIWLIDRRGGEAQQITDSKARISGFEWAPDSNVWPCW